MDGPVTLEALLHYHANEVDSCTDEERPFHDAAVKLISETMQTLANAPQPVELPAVAGGTTVVFDEVVAPNRVQERSKVLVMPFVPLPGMGVRLNGRDYQAQAIFCDVKGSVQEIHVLIGRVIKPGEILPASEQQLQQMQPPPGSKILRG